MKEKAQQQIECAEQLRQEGRAQSSPHSKAAVHRVPAEPVLILLLSGIKEKWVFAFRDERFLPGARGRAQMSREGFVAKGT